MAKELVLKVVLREEPEGGYSVFSPELGVASQGENIDDALKNIKEAVELYLDSAEELGILDEILEKLGLTKKDLKKNTIVPKVITADVPVELAA